MAPLSHSTPTTLLPTHRVPLVHETWSFWRRLWWSFQALWTVITLLPLIFASLVYLILWSLGQRLFKKKQPSFVQRPQYSTWI